MDELSRAAGRSGSLRLARPSWPALVVIIAAVVFAIALGSLSVRRYDNFRNFRNDLGNMVQAVDATAHGRFLEVTNVQGEQMSRLGAHVDPIIALFALPWLVWPSPVMLLLAQAAIVALSALPAYRLGLRVFKDEIAAMLAVGALLLYPAMQFVVLDEFHPVTLAVPLLLFAFLAVEDDRIRTAVPFLVLAALCKEDIPLVIAAMGVYFAIRKRRWWPLWITAAAGVYFAVAAGVVIPHFYGSASHFAARYAGGEDGLRGVVTDLVTHPWRIVTAPVTGQGRGPLIHLLWPFAFTPLASPLTTLIALPELLVNSLSAKHQQLTIEYHYVAGEIPFFFAGMVLGVARLTRAAARGASPDASRGVDVAGTPRPRLWRLTRLVAAVVLATALVANFTIGPLSGRIPGTHSVNSAAHVRVLEHAASLVPPGAVISADSPFGAHLSARRVIYLFPRVKDAEYVVVDSSRFGPVQSRRLAALKRDDAYQLVFSQDGVLLFERATGP